MRRSGATGGRDAAGRRPGVPHRHRAAAQRQRGLALRPRADLRRRRRDGRGPGRRGRLAGRRPRRSTATSPKPRRSASCARRSRRRTGASTSSPGPTRREPGWARRSRRRSSTPPAKRSCIGHVGDSRAYRLRDGKLGAADPRPLAGRGDAPQGPDHRRAGRGPPAALDHHPGAGPRTGGRGRRADRPGRARRRLPALLRRADHDGRRGADRRDPRRRGPVGAGGARAGRRGQPGRRPRQHHRARLPARGRRGAAAPAARGRR